jgi:DNA recombination protein RmuC
LAATQGVIPASPLTLIAVLRAVAYGWQQNDLVQNAEELSKLGKEMYDRLCTMADNLGELG